MNNKKFDFIATETFSQINNTIVNIDLFDSHLYNNVTGNKCVTVQGSNYNEKGMLQIEKTFGFVIAATADEAKKMILNKIES